MTALGADKNVANDPGEFIAYPVADSVKIYKGALVSLHLGYAVPAADTAGDFCVGIAVEQADNTVAGHTAGGILVRVQSGMEAIGLAAAGMAASDNGATVMATDSATVAKTSTNSVKVGRIVAVNSATSVNVFIPRGGVV